MSDKPKRYSLENPQMQEMWKKKTYQSLKDSFRGYKDFYDWGRFLETHYAGVYDDYLQLKDFPEDWLDDVTNWPVLGEMITLWYYDPIDAIKFYLSIVREMIEDNFYNPVNESRNIIKKILKEETDKEKRFKDMVLNHMLKNYSENRYDTKTSDPKVFASWANKYVKRDLEEKYGITEKNHPEIYHYIMDEYYHRVTGLLKKRTRVRLIFMNDKYTTLKKGDEGTIVGYSHTPWGTDYLVRWDSGSTLNLVPKEDEFEVLS